MLVSNIENPKARLISEPRIFSSEKIKAICLEEGADDAGFVEITRQALGNVQNEARTLYPKTKTIISICKRTNPENIQSVSRPLANEEFHKTYDDLSIIARKILRRLNEEGIRGVSCHPTFPMDMNNWAGKIWQISHKPIAEQAGIGKTGINRMILHPKFGTFILLDSILIDGIVDKYGTPLDYDPCVSCMLCVSACPVGALDSKKGLDFNACITHNYRDFMGGFEDWVENIVSSNTVEEFRKKSSDDENVSKWQSLSFGPQYKAAYCISVCPAGDDLYGIYKSDRKSWNEQIVKPLKNKKEPVYVGKDTQAEESARRNPNKEIRYVKNALRPNSMYSFLSGARVAFERKHAAGVNLIVHFDFNGSDSGQATILIRDGLIDVRQGLVEKPDLVITADVASWLKIVNREADQNTMSEIFSSGKIKVQGNMADLQRFQDCFVGQ
jgi:epoxyqueuosine reductase QueG/putative sterol carrier protein